MVDWGQLNRWNTIEKLRSGHFPLRGAQPKEISSADELCSSPSYGLLDPKRSIPPEKWSLRSVSVIETGVCQKGIEYIWVPMQEESNVMTTYDSEAVKMVYWHGYDDSCLDYYFIIDDGTDFLVVANIEQRFMIICPEFTCYDLRYSNNAVKGINNPRTELTVESLISFIKLKTSA